MVGARTFGPDVYAEQISGNIGTAESGLFESGFQIFRNLGRLSTMSSKGVNRESFDHSGLYRRRAYGEKRDGTDKYVGPGMAWFQVIFHGEKN